MSEGDQNNAEEPIPDGMVRKRRRVRKRRSSSPERSSGKEEANKLFAKAKELLIGMHDEDEDFGWDEGDVLACCWVGGSFPYNFLICQIKTDVFLLYSSFFVRDVIVLE